MTTKKITYCILLILLLTIHKLESVGGSLLPFSSGPGPLFSFGLNVQPAKTLVYRQVYALHERDLTTELVMHNHFYYGMTDRLTLVLKQPIILKRRTNGIHSRGPGNVHIELETIPYIYEIPDEFRFRLTTVTGIIPPTTTIKARTQLSLHSNSYFIYATQSVTTQQLFQYSGIGAFITTQKNGFNYGSMLYYDLGIAYNIINNDSFNFNVDFEMSGEYQQARTVNYVKDYATGDNAIFFGPQIRVSTKHFIGQIGMQYPWIVHLKRPPTNPINYRLSVAGAFRYIF